VYEADALVLTIEDNGTGFDVASIPKSTRADNSGFGLSMMKERVYLLSGKIDIQSEEGNGCKIVVEIPIKGEDETTWQ
jgi:two-component system sensor histidine kinase DegS